MSYILVNVSDEMSFRDLQMLAKFFSRDGKEPEILGSSSVPVL